MGGAQQKNFKFYHTPTGCGYLLRHDPQGACQERHPHQGQGRNLLQDSRCSGAHTIENERSNKYKKCAPHTRVFGMHRRRGACSNFTPRKLWVYPSSDAGRDETSNITRLRSKSSTAAIREGQRAVSKGRHTRCEHWQHQEGRKYSSIAASWHMDQIYRTSLENAGRTTKSHHPKHQRTKAKREALWSGSMFAKLENRARNVSRWRKTIASKSKETWAETTD